MSEPTTATGRLYLPGIDAMRGVLVIVGMLFHANVPLFRSGFFFVDVFGVLSGYLITRLLLAEHAFTGRIRLKNFYLARARRLLPALYLTLVGVILYARVTRPDILGDLRAETLAAVGYVYNWYVIFTGSDYFNSYAVMPLQHLWTLALEEQFYVLWPLGLIGLISVLGRRRSLLPFLLLAMAALSAAMSAIVYFGGDTANTTDFLRAPMTIIGEPVNRLMFTYMSTLTRAGGFLVGCALAFWWQPEQITGTSKRTDRLIDIGGVVALAGVIVLTNLQWFSDRVYALSVSGGQVAVWLICVMLIVSLTRPQSRWMHFLLTRKPLIRLGVLSYALYLFHWPVFQFIRGYPFKVMSTTSLVVGFPIMILLGELSLRAVERPIRRHGVKGYLATMTRPVRALSVVGTALVTGAAVMSLVTAPSGASSFEKEIGNALENSTAITGPTETIAIGDSVILGAYKELAAIGVTVDAATSRTFREGSAMVEALVVQGLVTDAVVSHLGNSDPIDEPALTAMLEQTRELRRVVLITVARPPESFVDPNNELLRSTADRYENVVVLDWNAVTAAYPFLLRSDQVHISNQGFPIYTALVDAALDGQGGTIIGPDDVEGIAERAGLTVGSSGGQ